uniref:ARAD1C07018p n=1 Tax=Blastobotrys adeninivorans TaxID=409370 RepID=A0A060T5R2_BLAAD
MSAIPLGQYLFTRLKQLDVGTVFGAPGDFNLSLLDHLYNVPDMCWAGSTNELNGGYAADGYARIRRLGAIVTTFGVGELSAINALAGAYSEHVGVVHIVGYPSTSAQDSKRMIHHTLGNGDFRAFHRMSSEVSIVSHVLDDIEKAPGQIDDALRAAYVHQRPVYLGIPSNFADMDVPSDLLSAPIDLSLESNPTHAEKEVLSRVVELINKAQRPVILVDAFAVRHGVGNETRQFADKTNFPVFATPTGRSIVDETNPRFGGIYIGFLSNPDVKAVVETADLVLSIGPMPSDFNTASFSYEFSTDNVVEFHFDHTTVCSMDYGGVKMAHLLPRLSEKLTSKELAKPLVPVPSIPTDVPSVKSTDPINHEWLWPRLSGWLRPGDILLSESGTSHFGTLRTKLPSGAAAITSFMWAAIGYTVGAAFGAAMAARDVGDDRRVVLFVGDGSLQMTATEVSSMVRWGLKPYIFVINNDGYTVERLIHGERQTYNDLHMWQYTKMVDLYNAKQGEAHLVESTADLESLFSSNDFSEASKFRVIEVKMPLMDAPSNIKMQTAKMAAANAKK